MAPRSLTMLRSFIACLSLTTLAQANSLQKRAVTNPGPDGWTSIGCYTLVTCSFSRSFIRRIGLVLGLLCGISLFIAATFGLAWIPIEALFHSFGCCHNLKRSFLRDVLPVLPVLVIVVFFVAAR